MKNCKWTTTGILAMQNAQILVLLYAVTSRHNNINVLGGRSGRSIVRLQWRHDMYSVCGCGRQLLEQYTPVHGAAHTSTVLHYCSHARAAAAAHQLTDSVTACSRAATVIKPSQRPPASCQLLQLSVLHYWLQTDTCHKTQRLHSHWLHSCSRQLANQLPRQEYNRQEYKNTCALLPTPATRPVCSVYTLSFIHRRTHGPPSLPLDAVCQCDTSSHAR